MIPKVGLNLDALERTGDVQGSYVRGPGGPNALPAMVRRKFIGKTAGKVVCLSDIYRVPTPLAGGATEDVNAASGAVERTDGVQLKLVSCTGCPAPDNDDA